MIGSLISVYDALQRRPSNEWISLLPLIAGTVLQIGSSYSHVCRSKMHHEMSSVLWTSTVRGTMAVIATRKHHAKLAGLQLPSTAMQPSCPGQSENFDSFDIIGENSQNPLQINDFFCVLKQKGSSCFYRLRWAGFLGLQEMDFEISADAAKHKGF